MERDTPNAGRLTPRSPKVLCASLLSLALLLAAWAAVASATSSPRALQTITVTNKNDSGPGSLRQAIAGAADGDTVNFAPGLGGTITLTSGELFINKHLTIVGPGANVLAVSGNNASRVFNTPNVVNISGLTISNGRTTATGGGILSSGTLTLDGCAVSNNVADESNGGGIFSTGELTIRNSTVSGNQTPSGSFGGGIFILAGTADITNSTISGNSAPLGGNGGGIFNGGTLTVTACTVTNNTAAQGGGIRAAGGTTALRSSIAAGNTAGVGPDINGTVTSQGFNLVGNNAGATLTPTTGDQIGTNAAPVDPLLGPLSNNGGPTPTHNLNRGGPARDAGDDSITGPPFNLSTDQRGSARRRGPRVDVGAFEEQGFFVTNTNDGGPGSLRQAILDANVTTGLGVITFAIPTPGVRTISPLSQLPDITDPVYIDGYTQPGSTPNTLPAGSNAVLRVELSGASGGAANGLLVRSSGSTIRGLVINRFPDRGISIQPGGGNTIEGCFIGTDATGTVALPNHGGILTFVSGGNLIGGTTNAARNVISGNSHHGVDLFKQGVEVGVATGNTVAGNIIGLNAAGTAALPNAGNGILIHDSANNAVSRNVISGNAFYGVVTVTDQGVPSINNQILGNLIGTDAAGSADLGNGQGGVGFNTSSNTVGGAGTGAANVIAFNGSPGGVSVAGGTRNAIRSNSIHSNDALGIDIGPAGVTPNDAGDADTGPNNRQNFPVITSATGAASQTTVQGTLNSAARTQFTIEFFSNPTCDPSGNGEGQTFLGSTSVTTDALGNANVSAVLPAGTAAGQTVTATATDPSGNTSEFSACRVVTTGPQTFAVTNANDAGAGSLRQAILNANSNSGTTDTIAFNIPGSGVRTISPTSALPDITDPAVIDGYTQPGSSQNTLATGDDAVLLIELNGTGAGVANGLHATGGSTIRGLVVNRFTGVNFASGNAVFLQGSGNKVEGCFLGTDASGTAGLGNSRSGVFANGAVANLVGGASPAARNLLSGNANGIDIVFSNNNVIVGNYIGTTRDGVSPLGNSVQGVLINASSNNTVGGTTAGERNVIAFNGSAGVNIIANATGNRVLGNSIHSNTALGIDIDNDGVTPNDTGDADTGTNNRQNFPVVNTAQTVGANTSVTGTFNSTPATNGFRIEFFSSTACHASGNGQGRTFLGSTNVNTDASGNASFFATLSTAAAPGEFVTATATDPAGNTSEFSPCAAVTSATTFTVTNANNAGAGSLRQAITDANATPGLQTINFNIPGSGVQTISPTSALPAVTDPVIIDGYTQPGSSPNTLPAGDNAVLLVELDGTGAGVANGLTLGAGNSTVRGLVFRRFRGDGVVVGGDGNTVEGCFVGTSPDGKAASPNLGSGVHVNNGSGNTVGGTSPAARNVVSGNNLQGVRLVSSSSNRVQGNFVGVAADGMSPLGNSLGGVLVVTLSNNNFVGGSAAGAGNVIANNGGNGGVSVGPNCAGNAVLGNAVYGNAGLGIDLFLNGVTPNDDGEGDADAGANNSQNFPALTSAAVVVGAATIFGALDSTPNRNFTVQFFSNASCDSSGNGEGQRFLGSSSVTTDASGKASVAAGPFPGVASGEVMTATATDNATNDTSEFSQCRTAVTATALTVTNTSDDGEGSLRRALVTIEDGGSINFAPEVRGTVTLASELVVGRRVNITGPGSNLLTLSGNNVRRLLNIQSGGAASVSGLSFSNGKADDGGAILNAGALTLTNCTVSISGAARGGGVFNSGSLNVVGSTLNSNTADEGGAIFNAGAANVSASTLNGNAARAGGGVFNVGGALAVTNATVSDNRAGERGGGIANGGGQVTITASTVAANTSLAQSRSGGGVSNAGGALTLGSSIVADNTAGAGADDISGAVNSLDFNLVGDASGATVTGLTANNKTGVSPRLGPLQNNGGPTDTRALLSGSPALDAGDDALALTLGTDQRGRPRRVDGDSDGSQLTDIGAFESGFSLSGIVRDADTSSLSDVAVTLTGNSVTRTALSTAAPPRRNNFTIMDVPAGPGYEIKAKASLKLNETFSYSFPTVCVDVSAAGVVTACGTQDVVRVLDIAGEKRERRFADIEGRVTDGAGRGVGGVTITLSGPKTVVLKVPGCQAQDSACGRYEFADVPTGADYTMTPKRDVVGFAAHPFDNGRGGADMNNLGADGAADEDGKVTIVVDFDAGLGPAPPAPNDNFTSPTPDPNRFKSGVLSLTAESLEPAVRVVQSNGQLQITPPDSGARATQAATLSAAPSADAAAERFNGYVSVRDIDLNTSTNVSVKADQPIYDGGEQTVFSVGSDAGNFYRIRVGSPSSALGPLGAASQINSGVKTTTALAADSPAIFFEAFTGGSKFQSAAPFDASADVFWRLRFEPATPAPPAACADASPQNFVLFETSVDRSAWTTRYCAPLGSDRTHVAAELLAGIVGNSTRDPGTAKFSDYRVSDRTGLGFASPDTLEIEKGAASVRHLRLTRFGDASSVASAASVVIKVAGSTVTSPPPCANADSADAPALPCKIFFAPGQRVAAFAFANPARDAADGDRLTLALEAPSGGDLDANAGAATLTLTVVDRGFRGNRIGESVFFAEQHYCDFLNRPADDAGRQFWTNEIENCGTGPGSAQCREVKRINVSAAFFLSIEYKETSYFVYRLYQLSFGRVPLRDEMLVDAGAVGRGVVVGQGAWQQTLEANKRGFVEAWVQGSNFKARFDAMKSAEFVDALYSNAGVVPSPDVRANLILQLVTGRITRAQVLRAAAEDARTDAAHKNRAFVLTQYFGYLRRDPDEVGFNFWLKKLDDNNGDFVAAEMVKAFIDSDEYRNRFRDRPLPSCGP